MSHKSVKDRWGVDLPTLFDTLERAGLISNERSGLRFSRFFWLGSQQIAKEEWALPHIPQLVPFARTPGRDHYAFHYDGSAAPWVAECPRDSDLATGYAPSFEGFLYRAMLEELCDCWLPSVLDLNIEETRDLLMSYAARLRPHLNERWGTTVVRIAQDPFRNLDEGRIGSISNSDVSVILKMDLQFAMLNKDFSQHIG